MPYIPPALRDRPNYKPKKINLRPAVDYTKLKTKTMIFEEYQKQNNGKADDAWFDENEIRGLKT